MSQLNILPIGKTTVFYPINCKIPLVRTGTIAKDSLFHAILNSISTEYITLDTNSKIAAVDKFKKSIQSIQSVITFQEHVNTLINKLYTDLQSDQIYEPPGGPTQPGRTSGRAPHSPTGGSVGPTQPSVVLVQNNGDIETYRLITEMLPIERFEKHILPEAYKTLDHKDISQYKHIILSQSIEYYRQQFEQIKDLDQCTINFYINKLEQLIQDIVDQAEKLLIEDHNIIIPLIEQTINKQINIIDSITRKLIKPVSTTNTSILVLSHKNQYEAVGLLKSGNRIQREFEPIDLQYLFT